MLTWIIVKHKIKSFFSWCYKHWKIVTAAIVAFIIYMIGLSSGNRKAEKEKKLRKLADSDKDIIKKTTDDIIEKSIEAHAENRKAHKKIETDRLRKIDEAKKASRKEKEKIENNPDKLDSILKEKHNLKKE